MKFKYFFALVALFSFNAQASECLVIKDLNKNKIIKNSNEKLCKTRISPASTFKIPLSLMGFDSGVLKDEKNPEVEWKEGYDVNSAKKDDTKPHDPTSWMKNSCVWYSQEVVTKKIGIEKFKEYVERFDYGNKDISGEKGKNNGLTHSWLCTSLEISPLEQIDFLSKMLDRKLGVSDHAYEMTEKITYIQDINGWKLHGKTGTCGHLNKDGSRSSSRFVGWFVGWIEKGDRKIAFAKFIDDDNNIIINDINDYAGPRAKKAVINELSEMKLNE